MINKNHLLFLIFIITFFFCSGQHNLKDSIFSSGEVLTNDDNDFFCQYNLIVELDPDYNNKLLVTFVFINGNNNKAIQFRQENIEGKIEWLNIEPGISHKEKIVEYVTAFVEAEHVLSWKFRYSYKTKKINNKNCIVFDKSALLIMSDRLQIIKKKFSNTLFIKK